MPLNNYAFFTLDPNTSGTESIQITPGSGEVELASLTIDTTGSSAVHLQATVGWHDAVEAETGLRVRIRRNSISGPVLIRARHQSTFNFEGISFKEFALTDMTHVDSPTDGNTTYVLTAELDPASAADGQRAKIIGPITLIAKAIS